MGEVLQFGDGRRRDALILWLRDELAATGSVSQRLGEVTVSVEEWRKAARAAGRELGSRADARGSRCGARGSHGLAAG